MRSMRGGLVMNTDRTLVTLVWTCVALTAALLAINVMALIR